MVSLRTRKPKGGNKSDATARRSAGQESRAQTGAGQKYRRLLRRIGIEGAFAAGIVGVLAGLMVLAGNLESASRSEQDTLRRDVQQVRTQTARLNAQVEDLGVAAQIYTDLSQRRQNMDFVADRAKVRPILARLKQKYSLTTLNLQFSPQRELDLQALELVKGRALRIDLTINVGGLADHYLYAFIQDFKRQFPGIVQLQSVQMNRRQRITIDVLSQISRGNPVETVSGVIGFAWYGYEKPLEQDGAEEEAAATGGAG